MDLSDPDWQMQSPCFSLHAGTGAAKTTAAQHRFSFTWAAERLVYLKAWPFFRVYWLVQENKLTTHTAPSFLNVLIITAITLPLLQLMLQHERPCLAKGRWFVFCSCSALDLCKSMAVVKVAGGKGLVCNSHICYKMEHFLITVFLMSSESSHPGVKMHACSRTLRISALYSLIFKIRFLLAVMLFVWGFNFWARAACIWWLWREKQGRDTIPVVLTFRRGFFNCCRKKQWKQNSHYFCAPEFTLLNNDSADTQRLLCFQFAGCSSIFSTPMKAAVSKYLSAISHFP